MLGAIMGDMIGSIYEGNKEKPKIVNLDFFGTRMSDDSFHAIAVAKTLLKHYPIKYDEESLKAIQKDLIINLANTWKENPTAGYGMLFINWA